jgi:hypothetical protein
MRNCKALSLFCASIGVAALVAVSRPAAAVTIENASATFTSQNLGGGEWQYDITLSNNSSADNANTTVGTFWFSWAPGQEYMEAKPTDVLSPTGWTEKLTGEENAGDGNAIQWVAMSGSLLHAGSSLSGFQFDSTESPSQITGPSSFFQNQPETLSAAYTQGPFSDSTNGGDVFNVTEVSDNNPIPPINGSGGGSGSSGASAVPLPAASGQALATLFGLGLIAMGKKLVKRLQPEPC